MDLNHVLGYLVGLASVAFLWRLARMPRGFQRNPGWVGVVSLSLVVLGVGLAVWPKVAGLAAAAVWGLLVLLPLLLSGTVHRLALGQRYEAARKWSVLLAWLHPWDGYRESPLALGALKQAQEGRLDEAETTLWGLQRGDSEIAHLARLHLIRLRGRWDEAVAWMEEEPRLLRDPALLVVYLRALGEVGRLDDMAAAYQKHSRAIAAAGQSAMAHLFLLALAGQPDALSHLYKSRLGAIPAETRDFWLATALAAAGRREEAEGKLRPLLKSPDAIIRAIAARRLESPPAVAAEAMSEASREVIRGLLREVEAEEKYGWPNARGWPAGLVTYLLILINLDLFALEAVRGSTTSLFILYPLGALMPSAAYLHGEWWRVVAYAFLHFGPVHLVVNMLGLFYLGPFVERALGRGLYLLCYLTCAAGSGLVLVFLTAQRFLPHRTYVGASGAVLGLVGITFSILWRGWRAERTELARSRMLGVAAVIVAQGIFDQLNPYVSAEAHLAGMGIGLLLGLVVPVPVPARREEPQRFEGVGA